LFVCLFVSVTVVVFMLLGYFYSPFFHFFSFLTVFLFHFCVVEFLLLTFELCECFDFMVAVLRWTATGAMTN